MYIEEIIRVMYDSDVGISTLLMSLLIKIH